MLSDGARRQDSSAARETRVDRRSTARAIGLGLLLALLTCTVLVLDLLPTNRVILNAGDISPQDILAPADLAYESPIRTQQAQDARAGEVQEIYDPPDASVTRQQELRARQILEYISTIRQDTYANRQEQIRSIASIPDVALSEEIIEWILDLSDIAWQQVRDETVGVLIRAMQGEIRESQVDTVRRRLPTFISTSLTLIQTRVVEALAGGLVKANTFYNAARTDEARQKARDTTAPATVPIRLGEAIVRAGDRVLPIHIEILDAFGLRQPATRWQSVLGLALFSLLVVLLLELLAFRLQPGLWSSAKAPAVFLALVALFVIAGKMMLPADDRVIPFLYPIPALSMILTLFLGPVLGVAIGVVTCLVGIFVAGGALEITIYLLASTLIGALALGRGERLKSFLQTGLAVALTNATVIITFGLLTPEQDTLGVSITVLIGLVMGGLAASITLAAFFGLSSILDVITPFQLMELSRPTHPLFHQLLLKAPGTYQHSMVVSNMAEEAANRVGADGLLARVGSYYHDIGKTVRPLFFAENRGGDIDPHEHLDPATSAQIVVSHVPDGLDLAEKYNLPAPIRAFIPEHQGTGLTLSFYRMAVKAAEATGQPVDEATYRYPGPRPQSQETAIVMLADSCEARVRSARPSSPDQIDRILRDTIKYKLDHGELGESDLTLRDLDRIREAFLSVLLGMFHTRVEYPEPVKVKGPDGQEIIR